MNKPLKKKGWITVVGALSLLAVTSFQPAQAWGPKVHQLIAQIAQERLTPTAKKRVNALLTLEGDADLASIASWADYDAPKDTKRWHYVNFEEGDCHYRRERLCPSGNCVVEAVKQQIAILKDGSTNPEKRLIALKYVVHLVGDIYQPLHDGFAQDRGGNRYRIKSPYRAKNLHAFWDTDLFKLSKLDSESILTQMQTAAFSEKELTFDPVEIAQNNCEMVSEKSFYPPYHVKMSYVKHYEPLLKKNIELSGAQLAQILNQAFAPAK